MSEPLISAADGAAIPLHLVRKQDLDRFLHRRSGAVRAQLDVQGFRASAGQTCAVLRANGGVTLAVVGLGVSGLVHQQPR